ncbi:MAG: rRNA maturation RNase YbeY [Nostocales cyanobacterium ELA583]
MPLAVELYLENCFDDSSPLAVNVGNNYPILLETWENWFQQWLENLLDYLPIAPSYEISLRLTNDTEIQTLNSQYRQQDKPTDVLAFASLEADLPQSEEMLASMPLYLGDIIVSIDTAKRQAQQQEHSLPTELAWLTAHGLLHLLGWDHPDEESLTEMLNEQVVLLKKIGIIINLEP